jgi:hypothetical protein
MARQASIVPMRLRSRRARTSSRFRDIAAGRVDEDRHRSECGLHAAHHRRHRGLIADIRGRHAGPDPAALNVGMRCREIRELSKFRRCLLVLIVHRDVGAKFRQPRRDGVAQPAARPGDEGHLALEREFRVNHHASHGR